MDTCPCTAAALSPLYTKPVYDTRFDMVAGMKFVALFALFSGVVAAYPTWHQKRATDPQSSLTLDATQVQKGLEQDGSSGPGATPRQSKSKTSSNNLCVRAVRFAMRTSPPHPIHSINFCLTSSLPLMDGRQGDYAHNCQRAGPSPLFQ